MIERGSSCHSFQMRSSLIVDYSNMKTSIQRVKMDLQTPTEDHKLWMLSLMKLNLLIDIEVMLLGNMLESYSKM